MEALISAPVLWVWIYWTVARSISCFPSLSMSTTWPPTMPYDPAQRPISWITSSSVAAGTREAQAGLLMAMNASVSSASPARMATASPYTLWLVGLPRRKSSSSMAGRSSWIRE